MAVLPVIVGYGGFNAAGRSSFDQSYRRMILESVSASERDKTLSGLAAMMNLVRWEDGQFVNDQGFAGGPKEVAEHFGTQVVDGTLIRRIEANHFDPDAVPQYASLNADLDAEGPGASFTLPKKQLPDPLPEGWEVSPVEDGLIGADSSGTGMVQVRISGQQACRVAGAQAIGVKAAGQLPTGFDPSILYQSRFQPRGLQMAVCGATDALRSMGVSWETICAAVRPDEIGTYASSGLGQLGEEGFGGMIRARLEGGRVSSKQMPMGLNTMPADFINAYVLGSLGHTEAVTGACASFLYNLHAAVRDIRRGVRRVALVGACEAPITPAVIDGFNNMSALATEENMLRLGDADPRRYSRPFGENAGFVMAESTQYFFLMDDALAVELGLDIHGAVPDVFIDADGVKKSISGPGPGNYLSFGKAAASARAILGEEALRKRSVIFAHGSSTPQNRVTESIIFHRIAEAFGVEQWPLCAVKAYLGHPLAPASADQMVAAIGAMKHGWVPGIKTMDAVADDVHQQHLNIPLKDLQVEQGLDISLLNSKGFGGNNATGVVLSARATEKMLAKRHSDQWSDYVSRREVTRLAAAEYEVRADRAQFDPIYRFGEGAIPDEEILISDESIAVPGFGKAIPLSRENPYEDMS